MNHLPAAVASIAILSITVAFTSTSSVETRRSASSSISDAENAGTNASLGISLSATQITPGGHAVGIRHPVLMRHIYWTSWNMSEALIGRADIDGSNAEPAFIHSLQNGSLGLAVDHQAIYWCNSPSPSSLPSYIGRADLDGSNANESLVVLGTGHYFTGLATDADHIYWADADAQIQSIGRAKLDGTDVQPVLILTGLGGLPFGVAVDAHFIYWTDEGYYRIVRSDLNGSNALLIHSTASNLEGIAVNASHIYWVEVASTQPLRSTICRADLDGSNPDTSFIPDIPFGIIGVTTDESYIYWASYCDYSCQNHAIGRARLDGSDVTPNFIPLATPPYSIAVGD